MEVEVSTYSVSIDGLPARRDFCTNFHWKARCYRGSWLSCSSYPCWTCVVFIICFQLLVYCVQLSFEDYPQQCDGGHPASLGKFMWFRPKSMAACCNPKSTPACPNPIVLKYGVACECRGDSCGDIPSVDLSKLHIGNALIVTSHSGESTEFMISKYVALDSFTQLSKTSMELQIDLNTRYQKIIGFGGAFTDAVAHNYAQFQPSVQHQFIRSHFGKGGAGYTLGRVNMNGCDFSRMDYTLANVTDDYALEHFCIRDDSAPFPPCGTDYKTTLIKAAQTAIRDVSSARSLSLYASSWTAPLWLKDQNFTCRVDHSSFYPPGSCSPQPAKAALDCSRNVGWSESGATNSDRLSKIKLTRSSRKSPVRNSNGNCFCTGFLRSDDRAMSTWANFFRKFIDAYKSMGVTIWGVTVQNEPLATTSMWTAMYFTAEMQANFVANFLGPTLRKSHPEVKIMIHDDNVPSLLTFAGKILEDEAAAKYVDGVAYHWYASMGGVFEDDDAAGLVAKLAGNIAQYVVNRLGFTIPAAGGGAYVRKIWQQLQKQSIEKFVLGSEACNGANIGQGSWFGPSPGNWMYGYAYSHDVLWQLRNNAAGWTDWNLMLNEQGGPNAYGNFVASAVTFKDENTFYQEPMFFHLAHFSKYVLPGSIRIQVNVHCHARNRNWCQSVGFLTPEKNVVVIITNDELVGLPFGDVLKGLPIISRFTRPALAGGEGKELNWTIKLGDHTVSGVIPWKGIQTVIIPCGSECDEVYI